MKGILNTPKSVDLEITSSCNLRCSYCSHFTSSGDVNIDLPKEDWLRFFEELSRNAVLNVCISGGEPFCREDLKDIIEGVVRNRMRYTILTNGTLITDEMADFIASTRRCDSIQVSIDGSIPATHDVFRGIGSFHKAIKGIECLQRNKVPVTVRVTIHRNNVDDLENIAELLLEGLGLPSFSTNSAAHMGLCRKNTASLQLTPEERSWAMVKLQKLNKKFKGRISADAGPLAESIAWEKMEEAWASGRPVQWKGGGLTACGGPFNKLAVRADGVIVPCTQLSHIELGRINEDNLKEVWQHHTKLKILRERHGIPLSQFDFCKDCNYINYCTGGCPAIAYNLLGQENHPSPDYCFRRFIEEGGTLPQAD